MVSNPGRKRHARPGACVCNWHLSDNGAPEIRDQNVQKVKCEGETTTHRTILQTAKATLPSAYFAYSAVFPKGSPGRNSRDSPGGFLVHCPIESYCRICCSNTAKYEEACAYSLVIGSGVVRVGNGPIVRTVNVGNRR